MPNPSRVLSATSISIKKNPSEIPEEIKKSIQPEAKSDVGFDPFGLITQYGVQPIIESIHEVIERYDIAKIPNEPMGTETQDNNEVPKIIHLHWVGKDLIADERWKKIKI